MEEFVKFHVLVFLAIIVFTANLLTVSAQVDSVIGQITSSAQESYAGGISGDGRFVVFESIGDIATENPRNADGNREIFLFDYAQRRIFQITDTKSLLTDKTLAATNDNIKVAIVNLRPTISNDGRWIAFSSNANSLLIPATNLTPGNFDANVLPNDTTNNNPLLQDANTELWLYQVPSAPAANLSAGSEIPLTDLSAGTFVRVTNTTPSRLPVAGSTSTGPVVAEDNRDASINDNGDYVAFVSNRDLVLNGNAAPNDNNDEIFTYVRLSNAVSQVTKTSRGTITAPIYNQNPTISGDGLRVAFLSNAATPVIGMTTGSNADGNVEIFYTNLNAVGVPSVTAPNTTPGRQITTTTRTNPGDLVNVLDYGKRMSRDGRYIAFDSYADLVGGGANQTSFALYLFDTSATTNAFVQIGPRSDADTAASGGDISHFPSFTDYNSTRNAQTLVFETRQNIKADGTIPTTATDGLNSDAARPVQIYSYPLPPAAANTFTRLTTFPAPSGILALTQPITSDSRSRLTFNLAFTEVGTGNTDLQTEAYYFLLPTVNTTVTAALNFSTGASRLSLSATPTPTPTATPTPTVTPTPSVTPTPQTPARLTGVAPGLLTYVNFDGSVTPAITARTAIGSLQRSFTLPIELSGVTVTINGAAAGLKSVSQNEILFVVPPGLTAVTEGTNYPLVINNNGTIIRSTITVVPGRPDVFTTSATPGPGGRARIFNATNRVLTTEPITITTVRIRGGNRVPTVFRVYLTGVGGVPSANLTVRVGSTEVSGTSVSTPVLREPGVYSIDFTLPTTLRAAGDVPIIVTVNVGTTLFQSRLDDTAPRFRIL